MKDHRVVRIALFLFFVAISLVYAVFVQVRGDDIHQNLLTIVQKYGLVSTTTWTVVDSGSLLSWDQLASWEDTTGGFIDNSQTLDTSSSFLDDVLGTGKSQILSWTDLYYGSLDIIKTLGLRYEYILKDNTYDIFYAYIGSGKTYNVTDLVKWIGWKTVDIYAKNDIINNLYFWDRVTFVELPQSSPTNTSFFVRMGDQLWFVQDISGDYKKHKRHIRTVFTWK